MVVAVTVKKAVWGQLDVVGCRGGPEVAASVTEVMIAVVLVLLVLLVLVLVLLVVRGIVGSARAPAQ